MQHKITKPSRLLDKHGKLIQKGYATSPLLKYRRKDVARKSRLKEWDYYLVNNKDYAIAFTIGRSCSLLLISTSLIDIKNRKETTKNFVRLISEDCFSMPQSPKIGDIIIQDKKLSIAFLHEDGKRKLSMTVKSFEKNADLEVSILLSHEPKDTLVIATPFKKDKKKFYYNQKIIGMRASGTVRIGNKTISFSPVQSYGILDWGRGVWPYKTTWYWSAGQGMVWGNLFGFNLGYGFGDTSAATENMLFFNGKASKLEDVVFHIPKSKNKYMYLKPWAITSSDGRLVMEFNPIFDRSANLSAFLFSTNQHQVFGTFTGTAILDDGTVVYFNDFPGFAERVENRW